MIFRFHGMVESSMNNATPFASWFILSMSRNLNGYMPNTWVWAKVLANMPRLMISARLRYRAEYPPMSGGSGVRISLMTFMFGRV